MNTAEITIRIRVSREKPLPHTVAEVRKVPEAVIRQVLTAPERITEPGGPRGFRQKTRERRFFDTDSDGTVLVPPGLIERLAQWLVAHGWQVYVYDKRKIAHLDPEHGQVITRSRRDGLLWLLDAERGLLGQSVLIVVRNNRDGKWVQRQLRKRVTCLVTTDPDRAWHARKRIVIVGTGLFGGVNRADWDAVVFLGVEPLLTRNGQLGVEYCQYSPAWLPPRMFCIHDGRVLSRLEQLIVEAATGPVIYDDRPEPEGPPEVEVAVLTYPGTGDTRRNTDESPLQWKRRVIWHNEARNRLIAGLAKAIADGDGGTYEKLQLTDIAKDKTVAVIAESPEHGRELAALLPEWRLLTNGPDEKGCVPGVPVSHRTICTEYYLAQSYVQAEVLINAMGGLHPLRITTGYGHKHKLGLLEFAAACDNKTVDRETQVRLDAYRHNGWPVRLVTIGSLGQG